MLPESNVGDNVQKKQFKIKRLQENLVKYVI
jgi:hypothetical protein